MTGASVFILVFVIPLFHFPVISEALYAPERFLAEMDPNDPSVEEGMTLVLNCTLTSLYNGSFNASHIYFIHNNENLSYPYVTTITARTAQLRLPNMTVEHNGRFACALPDAADLGPLAAQAIHVARRPLEPFVESCVVDNWERMECTWGPSIALQKEHTQAPKALKQLLLWQYQDSGNDWKECPDFQPESAKCIWPASRFNMGQIYCIQVLLWNNVSPSNTSSNITCVKTEEIVKPKQVKNIRRQADNTNLTVEWDTPTSLDKPLTYHVEVQSKWGVDNFTVNETFLTLPMVPFTEYDVVVKALPSLLGFPSDESRMDNLLSASTVPCANPVVIPSGFSVDLSKPDERSVLLYWQPVKEKDYCGHGFQYEIHDPETRGGVILDRASAGNCSAKVALQQQRQYSIQIISRNDIGLAINPPVSLHIPSADAQRTMNYVVIAEGVSRTVMLHWFKTADFDNVKSCTLFWCQYQGASHLCRTPVQHRSLAAHEQGYNLTLGVDFDVHQFGLAFEFTDGSSSGIKWASRLHYLTAIPEPPIIDLKVEPSAEKHHGELQVKWDLPPCDKKCAYAHSFIISYCAVDQEKQCVGKAQNLTVDSKQTVISGSDTFLLTGLDFNTAYRVRMVSVARGGQSKWSEDAYGITTDSWFTPGNIAGLAIGVLLGSIIVFFGFYFTLRCCEKYRKKFTQGVKISLPSSQRIQHPSTSSEAAILRSQTDYGRQHSHISTLSGDSGHYSLTPSSPAMLPLLSADADSLERLKRHQKPQGVSNYYQTTAFNARDETTNENRAHEEKAAEEDNESGSVGAFTYQLVARDVSNGLIDTSNPSIANSLNQTQYIQPEQINQVGHAALPTTTCSCSLAEKNQSDVSYCPGLRFPAADNLPDIGYTKVEQLQPAWLNQSNSPRKNETEKNSNLLLQFDSSFDGEEFGENKSLNAGSHLDELLATLGADPSLISGLQFNDEPLNGSSNCPYSMVTVRDEAPCHSNPPQNDSKLTMPESHFFGNVAEPSDCGYVSHSRLFGGD